ncbi:N-terminal nucleophile aminohydrolase [Ramicandelaber brevisporus]|nr:N-terminal nucleophile aminohydrolase [Ramicandelaber brevisporus]
MTESTASCSSLFKALFTKGERSGIQPASQKQKYQPACLEKRTSTDDTRTLCDSSPSATTAANAKLTNTAAGAGATATAPFRPTVVIHGGAGPILRDNFPEDLQQKYRRALAEATMAGYAVLTDPTFNDSQSGPNSSSTRAVAAVEAAVRYMEDSPLFNAGVGAVFTEDGTNELEAAIVDGGKRLASGKITPIAAGTVMTVKTVKNPISLAKSVMNDGLHVTLAGPEVTEKFALKVGGHDIVDNKHFFTESRYKQHLEDLERRRNGGDDKAPAEPPTAHEDGDPTILPKGTVGAVALDEFGNVAAATSTGGRTNKMSGRVGDTPVIGAGSYASTADGAAVSATGHGEYFMRTCVGFDMVARVRYANQSLADAANAAMDVVGQNGGEGGVVAVDSAGTVVFSVNSKGMYRGFATKSITEGEQVVPHVAIFTDEETKPFVL